MLACAGDDSKLERQSARNEVLPQSCASHQERVTAPLTGAPLTLDTPMQAIFEDVGNWTAEGEPPITVRSLLTMTSNLPNFTRRPPENVDPWGAVPAPRLLNELKKWSPQGWPNSFEYSNTGYFLLAQIIGRVAPLAADGSYRDYVRAATIEKARMTHTGFVGEYAPGSDVADPHYRRKPAFAQPDWLNGCGDMASNAIDPVALKITRKFGFKIPGVRPELIQPMGIEFTNDGKLAFRTR